MGLQVADYGRGLPDDFYEKLHDVFDQPPEGVQVGATVKDYSRFLAVRLVRLGTISVTANTGMGMIFDANRKTIFGGTPEGGTRGQDSLVVSVGAAATVAKDDFARGKMIFRNGDLAPRQYYLTGNTAKNASNQITVYFNAKLPAAVNTLTTVMLIANKYMAVTVGANNHEIPAGGSLTRSPVSNKYAWLQWGGIGGMRNSAALATGVQDGTPLIKAAAGEVALQPDTNIKPVIGSIIKDDADTTLAANLMLPAEYAMGFEF